MSTIICRQVRISSTVSSKRSTLQHVVSSSRLLGGRYRLSRFDVRHVSDRSGLRRVLKTRDSELAEGNQKIEKASHKERSLKTLVVSVVYIMLHGRKYPTTMSDRCGIESNKEEESDKKEV
jgi:hypothetical protein